MTDVKMITRGGMAIPQKIGINYQVILSKDFQIKGKLVNLHLEDKELISFIVLSWMVK